MLCPTCGNELSDDAKFCPKCGTSIEPSQSQPTQPSFIPREENLPPTSNMGQPQPAPQQPAAQQPVAPQPAPPQQPAYQPQQQAPAPKKGMNPILRAIIALVGVAAIVFGVMQIIGAFGGGGSNEPEPEPTGQQVEVDPDSWTVFVYICGSNLESDWGLATDNIIELLEVDLPDNVQFVLETGGSNRWQNNVMDPNYLEYYTVEDNDIVLQNQIERESMAQAHVLADFLTWGVENYPAAHYGLVFWDHGGGTLGGVCQDELDYDTLELPEIREGIAAPDVHFDFIGFDTCLMATLETAQMIAPYADYMVASEEVEPGGGWAWGEWPQWFQTREGGVVGLGKTICDTYMDKCKHDRVAATATLSVVDLSKIDRLAEAFVDASSAMATASEDARTFQRMVQQGLAVRSFAHASYLEGYTDMVDLGSLMDCLDSSLGRADDRVNDELYNAVVYERHGMYMSGCSGLSVFYPLRIDHATFSDYYDLATEYGLDNVPYLQYLAVRAGEYDDFNWEGGVDNLDPVKASDADRIRCSARIAEDGTYVVDITKGSEWVAMTTFYVGVMLDDGTVVVLGSDNDMVLQDTDRASDTLTYADNFNGMWYKVGDAYVYAKLVETVQENGEPSYNLYATPCEWTTKDSNGNEVTYQVNLLISYDYDTQALEAVCVYQDADESGMAGKVTAALSDGDQLTFLVQREVDGEVVTGNTGSITWSSDTPITMAYLGDGQYVYVAAVRDIFGNEHQVAPALFTYENGERTGAELINTGE